jgi:hypothetical protein
MSNIGNFDLMDCDRFEPSSNAIDAFPVTIRAIAEQHRPSRMPFSKSGRSGSQGRQRAVVPRSDHLVYQSAMHATRAAVYHLRTSTALPFASASCRYSSMMTACREAIRTIIN